MILKNVEKNKSKIEHVASFIPVAGPFAGVPKAMRGIVSGDTFGAPDFLVNVTTGLNLYLFIYF